MKQTTEESPADRGFAEIEGRCQVCGAEGYVLAAPGAPEPNELCARCAAERWESDEAVEDVEFEI